MYRQDEETPLVNNYTPPPSYINNQHDSKNKKLSGPAFNKRILSASFKVASAVTIIFSLFLLTVGLAVYKETKVVGAKPEFLEESLILGKPKEMSSLPISNFDQCALNTKQNIAKTCDHRTTKFYVNANEEGKWPEGFSWTVLKDAGSDSEEKSFLHAETGKFDQSLSAGQDIRCKKFVTELCLKGDYVVYANSDHPSSADSSVDVCGQNVVADEALDFKADKIKCISSSFETDPDYSNFAIEEKNKIISRLQALSLSVQEQQPEPPQPPPQQSTSEPSSSPAIIPGIGAQPEPTQPPQPNSLPAPTLSPTGQAVYEVENFFNKTVPDWWSNETIKDSKWYNDTAREFPVWYNETIHGFLYPSAPPTLVPTISDAKGNSSCWMFGLICQRDLDAVGITVAPSSMPTRIPVIEKQAPALDVSDNSQNQSSCYMFGLICPRVITNAPTPSPTQTPALRTIDLQNQKEVYNSYPSNYRISRKLWYQEQWLSSPSWVDDLHCTIFGTSCHDDVPTYMPSSVPTSSPTHPLPRMNVTECHFFGIYCTQRTVRKLTLFYLYL